MAIRAPDEVYVRAASAWEAEIKRSLGKFTFPQSSGDILVFNNFKELPVTLAHAAAPARLPHHHRDLFGRMLVAQSRVAGCTLVTADRKLAVHGVLLIQA